MAIINGTNGNDTLSGTAGADTINLFAGNDTLIGCDGDDELVAGAGADRMFGSTGLDLADIDVNPDVNGNQAFTFIGQGPLTGAGQLRYFQADGVTVIEANTRQAKHGAEMWIILNGLVPLQVSDFRL